MIALKLKQKIHLAIPYRNLTDEDLLQQIANREDREAFRVIFDRYKHLALGVCLKYLPESEKAKDFAQNIFLKIWAHAQNYRFGNFKSRFYNFVKNQCLSELRKKDPTINPEDFKDSEDVEWTDYLQLKLKEEQLISHLNNCMKTLKQEEFQCIKHFYIEEKSYQETAFLTGFTNDAVKNYIQNGRKNLKNCMQAVIEAN